MISDLVILRHPSMNHFESWVNLFPKTILKIIYYQWSYLPLVFIGDPSTLSAILQGTSSTNESRYTFLLYHKYHDNAPTAMLIRIRLLKEWSDFYKKAVAMDDETRINDVPYKVKYSLLCQIFELILQNLPEAHATDQTFDIITDFLLTNLNMIRPAPREKEVDRVETLE